MPKAKPPKIGTRKTIIEVEYNDIERLIQKHYNRPDYEVVCDMEWGNYESHSQTLNKKPIHDHDQKKVDRFKSGDKTVRFIFWNLMQDLVNNDVLDEAEYSISIYW